MSVNPFEAMMAEKKRKEEEAKFKPKPKVTPLPKTEFKPAEKKIQ